MALETWNGRTAGQTDADSPLDTTLMDGLRKDLDHLRQVLYGSTDPNFHTPIWGHNHNGVNSASATVADGAITQAKLANAVVGQAQVKSSTAYVTGLIGATSRITITLADYSFYPNIASTNNTAAAGINQDAYYSATNPNSQVGKFDLYNKDSTSSHTYYINYRYITASEGLKVFVFKDSLGDEKCKYTFEDAPPNYMDIINEMAKNNNWIATQL